MTCFNISRQLLCTCGLNLLYQSCQASWFMLPESVCSYSPNELKGSSNTSRQASPVKSARIRPPGISGNSLFASASSSNALLRGNDQTAGKRCLLQCTYHDVFKCQETVCCSEGQLRQINSLNVYHYFMCGICVSKNCLLALLQLSITWFLPVLIFALSWLYALMEALYSFTALL